MNALNGLDGKSVLIGVALTLGGIAAVHGGVLPLLLVGGLFYIVGAKMGWWGRGPRPMGADPTGHRPPGGPPFFVEWHRQAHAAAAAYQAAPSHQPPAPAEAQPQEVNTRVPVAPAPTASAEPATVPEPAAPATDDRRPVGESGAPPA